MTRYGGIVYQLTLGMGIIFTVTELSCYILLYLYLTKHNAEVASKVLKGSELALRKKTNAFSIAGQVAGWFVNIWHIIILAFSSIFIDIKVAREVMPIIKLSEFFLLAVIQVYTSPPIRRYIRDR